MANYFQLTKIGENKPSSLSKIDEEICNHLGKPIDPNKYYLSWYDIVGLALAMGKDFAWCRNEFKDWKEMIEVIDYLEQNYTSTAWARRD